MATRHAPGLRSRIVRFLKIAFPLVAFGLLASVFLLSEKPLPETGLNFSDADLEAMKGGLRITDPQLSGASLTGDIYDFRARTVVPRDEAVTEADIDDLTGRIDYRDGRTVEIEAARAEVDLANRKMLLETGIRLRTSDGYTATADKVEVDAVAARLNASGNVTADGPIGRIEAATLTVEPAAEDQDPELGKEAVLSFGGGVRLRYQPATADEE